MADNGRDTSNRDDLTPKDATLLAAVLAEPTVKAAAKRAGISERTAYRRMERTAFQDALREAQEGALYAAVSSFQFTAQDSFAVLSTIMNDTSVPAAVRVRASLGLLSLMLRAMELRRNIHETQTLEKELAELRQMVEGRTPLEGSFGYAH
jgi:hypothetical protein